VSKLYIILDIRSCGRIYGAGATTEKKKTYKQLDERLQAHFFSHGNILAHTYTPGLTNQVSPTRDKKNKRDKGRHINVTFIRSMCFCGDLQGSYDLKWWNAKRGKYNYLPAGFKLQELYQPIIYLYDRTVIREMVEAGKADFMRLASESKTHKKDYENPNEYLGEYYIYDREDTPDPKYIIIGNIGTSLPIKERVDLENDILPKIAKRFPETDIIYFPNVNLRKSKKKKETGNFRTSVNGSRILRKILLVRQGKISPTRIII